MADLEALEDNEKTEQFKILKQTDLYNILPFQKTKVQQLIKSGQLPLVKIGKDYITTYKLLEEWIRNNLGEIAGSILLMDELIMHINKIQYSISFVIAGIYAFRVTTITVVIGYSTHSIMNWIHVSEKGEIKFL